MSAPPSALVQLVAAVEALPERCSVCGWTVLGVLRVRAALSAARVEFAEVERLKTSLSDTDAMYQAEQARAIQYATAARQHMADVARLRDALGDLLYHVDRAMEEFTVRPEGRRLLMPSVERASVALAPPDEEEESDRS